MPSKKAGRRFGPPACARSPALGFHAILFELNESHRHGKLARIQAVGGRLIRRRPDLLEHGNGHFGARKKFHRPPAANGTRAFRVGGLKQCAVVGLVVVCGESRERTDREQQQNTA